ncbi:S41 family peptidase [candidate division KSB1 bacterium]|nr:S41 family peptidase [candidate division KSB1 bacterium]
MKPRPFRIWLQSRTIRISVAGLILVLLTGATWQYYGAIQSMYTKAQLVIAVLERVHEDYVDEKNPDDLVENAISGVISSLDPHSTFMTAEDFDTWNQNFEGYSGIGIYFDIIQDKITIMSVISGGPSDAAGLHAGDRIVGISGVSAIGLKRDDVPLKLMGPRGTKVKISVERRGWTTIRDFLITRDEVHIKSVPYAFQLQNSTGYIRINRFSATTGKEFEEALKDLETRGMSQLILDLRQNGGGYLDAAVDIVDNLLPGGKRIVYTEGRVKNAFREYFSTERATHPLIPVIVLIDRTSASASEIVAGALQDWDRALIVGESSFGKGLVQSQYRFQDGSALLMTTARYHTPSGRVIQRAYDGKSLVDYYTEIDNDSLRNASDKDKSRPIYQTGLLKRPVLGGGGIQPDVFLKAKSDTLTEILRDLIFSPKRLFFTFSEAYVRKHPELKKDFHLFLQDYYADTPTLQLFLSYIRQQGFKISNSDFNKNQQQIAFLLKQNIAAEIWDDEARYKTQMLRDNQLLEAIGYFPESDKLLARAYPSASRSVNK